MTNTPELQPKAADYMTIEDDNLAVEALLNIRMVSDLFINADKTGVPCAVQRSLQSAAF